MRLALVIAATLCGSCSLVENWDRNGLPCEGANLICDGGDHYSCAPLGSDPNNRGCVLDGSLQPGDGCLLDRQCKAATPPYICPNAVQQCVQQCDLDQSFLGGCPLNTYCSPSKSVAMYSDQQVHAATLVAACVQADNCVIGNSCTGNSGLVAGGICVPMPNTARACLTACTITFGAAGYSDNCGHDDQGNLRYCQPVGATFGQYQMVCIDSPPPPSGPQVAVGHACSPVAAPCPSGAGCINGTCRAYCAPNTSGTSGACPASAANCCAYGGLNPAQQLTIGFCSPDASCST